VRKYKNDALKEVPCDDLAENLKNMLKILKSNPYNFELFLEAEQGFLMIGEPAVEMLIEVLRDNDEPLLIRERTGEVLRKIGRPAKEPLQALMSNINSEDLKTLELAAKVLMGIP
jgi:HEAT repeat protein